MFPLVFFPLALSLKHFPDEIVLNMFSQVSLLRIYFKELTKVSPNVLV